MYEALLMEADKERIEVVEYPFRGKIKGLYYDRTIGISKQIVTSAEKACILAEELGHHHTSAGNILDQDRLVNRKQEALARRWGYERLVPLDKLITAHELGILCPCELAEFLGVTGEFLADALQYYVQKYGYCCRVNDHVIHFEPLNVFRITA